MGRLSVSTALAALMLAAAGAAQAGSTSGGSSSSGGCGCVPTTHQVRVPGIEVTPPSVTVDLPTLNVYGAGGSSSANASAEANATTNVGVTVNTSTSGVSNAQAIINSNAFGGGGGGGFSDSGTVSTTIDSVHVETPQIETRRICAAFKAVAKVIAIQASCLDDKDIPHPASQLGPGRDIADGYEGEVYRCIAGARMQYTIADYSGQANFDHGQTFTCNKGEALYHSASGGLQCRPQKPARDCNERSLLRRFGAGIKVLKVSQSNVCAAWREEPVQASVASY